MSENKKVEAKKTPNVWVTILCIVLIIAMFFVGWFAGGKTAELEDKIIDKATEEKDKKKEEKVEKDIELVALRDDLISKVDKLEQISSDSNYIELWPGEKGRYFGKGDIYMKDIESSQIPDNSKLHLVLKELYWDKIGNRYDNNYEDYHVTTNYDFGDMTMYKDQYVQLDVDKTEKKYASLFGKNTIKHTSIEGCPSFIYDDINKKYYGRTECGGTGAAGIISYINRMTTKGNDAYVYISIGSYDPDNVYTDFEGTKKYKGNVGTGKNIINESNYKDFSEYKYTFVNEDDNYIFKSLERIK